MPGDLPRNTALARRLPTLLGDFLWAGWDYLGEAGGGAWTYGTRRAPFLKPYPQLTSQMGIFDITGVPGATVDLARTVFGLQRAPAVAVRPVDVAPGPVARSSWRSTDAVPSWSWAGHEGEHVEVEVCSADDEVEVLVNGRSLGRRPAGAGHGSLARFRGRWEPGVVEAVGYRGGRVVSRSALRSAGEAGLRLVVEDPLDPTGRDVAFVRVELADVDGVVDTSASDEVRVSIDGPARVAGFGNGAPSTEESFTDLVHTTYQARALLAVRGTGSGGPVLLTATSRSHGTVRATLEPPDDTEGTRT